VFEKIGKLTIMLFAMLKDLVGFALIYVVILAGFGVSLHSLLIKAESYGSISETL
jgi:hypothetical protein